MQLSGKVALITGAGSGLGKATALLLAKEGAKIATLGRNDDELKKVVSQIQKSDGESIAIVADISKPEEMQQAIEKIIQQWGRLDIVFANAGVNGLWAPIDEIPPEEWQKTIDINLNGTFYTVKYAVPYLKNQGGAVVITSSVNGTRMFSNSGASAYASTKAAQVAFAKMIALELAKYKIRVNVICPGAIESSIDENTDKQHLEKAKEQVEFPEGAIPLTDGKAGKAEDVAKLVLFLTSSMSDHITGTEVWIDGAQSLLQG